MNAQAARGKHVVVVGVDFDETGVNALREGVRVAGLEPKTDLHILYVIPGTSRTTRSVKALEQRSVELARTPRRLREFLGAQVANIPGLRPRNATLHARLGDPAQAILQLCVDVAANVVVVGTHGKTGVRRLVLGSVAQKLLGIARCPVLVARPADYSGLQQSAKAEPVCTDCARAREKSDGEVLWCEYHSRPQIRRHAYTSSEVFHIGGHDAGIVPPGA